MRGDSEGFVIEADYETIAVLEDFSAAQAVFSAIRGTMPHRKLRLFHRRVVEVTLVAKEATKPQQA